VAAASALHDVFFHNQLVLRLSETPLSYAQQRLLEQPGAAERIAKLDSGLVASQAEQVLRAFHGSFGAAFSGILRLNVMLPIMIGVLVVLLLGNRKAKVSDIHTYD
jgi:hypothetical protein